MPGCGTTRNTAESDATAPGGLPLKPALCAVAILFAAPLLADLALSGRMAPFRFFSVDAFYYFTVGRNFSELGFPTFDQTFPTNGFHPLWQFIVAGAYWLSAAAGLGETGFLYAIVLIGMLCAVAFIVFSALTLSVGGRLTAMFLVLPIGFYALAVSPVWIRYVLSGGLAAQNYHEGSQPLFGTLWSFVNGMESPATLALFAICGFLYVKGRWRESLGAAIVLGLCMGLLALARLDHALFPAVMLAGILLRGIARRDRRLVARSALMGFVFGAILVCYALANWMYCGMALPVSGSLKSTFPVFSSSLLYGISDLRQPFHTVGWLNSYWRLCQICVPLAVAVLVLLASAARFLKSRGQTDRGDADPAVSFLRMTAAGVVLLAAYNILFVRLLDQGHWYFPVSCAFVSLAAISAWQRSGLAKLPIMKALMPVGVAGTVCLHLVFYIALHRHSDYHEKLWRFYYEDARIVKNFYEGKNAKFLSFDDGIVAFSLPYPALSGTGLNADKGSVEAFKQGRLLDLAVARGHDRLVSLSYSNTIGLTGFSSTDEILTRLPYWKKIHASKTGYDLRMEFFTPSGTFGVVRAVKDVPAESGTGN
jgi:hypothetical protein